MFSTISYTGFHHIPSLPAIDPFIGASSLVLVEDCEYPVSLWEKVPVPTWLNTLCLPLCTQSMPVCRSSPSVTSMMTVSMRTWLSLTSIASMMLSTTGTSSLLVITTSPLIRSLARTVVFSFESSPGFASPVRWFALLRAADAAFAPCEPVGLETRVVPPCPRAAAFWLFLELLFDDGALPMRSLIMSETSFASAYLRR